MQIVKGFCQLITDLRREKYIGKNILRMFQKCHQNAVNHKRGRGNGKKESTCQLRVKEKKLKRLGRE